MKENCFHCGEPVYTGNQFQVEIQGQWQSMCCPGCEAVASTIIESGLSAYYRFRTNTAVSPALLPDELTAFDLYDHQAIQDEFVVDEATYKSVTLSIDGVSCAACAWLIEKKMNACHGIQKITVNTTTHRASVTWDHEQIQLSQILHQIQHLGYQATPFEADKQEAQYHQTMKKYLYRLGIAGLATMQVMMIALALYFEVFGDMDETFKQYFRWVSLIFATPVLLYSAYPFYRSAWRNLKARTLGMDVPVSIALLFAYFASLVATVTGEGEVFFESIAMFTFFLLIGRFLEMRARRTAAAMSANLLKLIPKLATLKTGQKIPVSQLQLGQVLSVLPGETVPTDGVIVSGVTSVNESMLTGEFLPVAKKVQDKIFAGTVNMEGNLDIQVTATPKHSLIAQIVTLQDQAQAHKPKVAEVADIVAKYFVAAILMISALTWWYWQSVQPEDAFWIMLSVLVATCPCALSLATPTALTCATSAFSQMGLMLRRGHVLQSLTQVNHIVLDKTGTITQGKISIEHVQCYADLNESEVLKIAASLESHANHPIASAFQSNDLPVKFSRVENCIGQGVIGWIDGEQWRIGHRNFAMPDASESDVEAHQVWLSRDGKLIASFLLIDPIRPEARQFVKQCHQAGIQMTLLTGDHSTNAESGGYIRDQTSYLPESRLKEN